MYLNYPVHKNCPHLFINVLLLLHVVWRRKVIFFIKQKYGKYMASMLGNKLGVVEILNVHCGGKVGLHLFGGVVPELSESFFQTIAFGRHSFVRNLVTSTV